VRVCGVDVWMYDDAWGPYAAYLAEALDGGAPGEWTHDLAKTLRVSSFVGAMHFVDIEPPSPGEHGTVREAAAQARRRAEAHGDITREDLRAWVMLDDFCVNRGEIREGAEVVLLARILQVADAVDSMLDGTLDPPPPGHWWFIGTGVPDATIGMDEPLG
jgi:hypothetical protein